MRKVLNFMAIALLSGSLFAQSAGDTIVVQSLHYGSATRDTIVNFPNDPSVTYSKILMKYSMRCKEGRVSTGQNRNLGCGEWDYSCNTYIHDPSKVDSLFSRQISHRISDFSGDTFYVASAATNTYYLNYQSNVSVDSIISENQFFVGDSSAGKSSGNNIFPNQPTSKSQYLFLASELNALGLLNGNIDGLMLEMNITPPSVPTANQLRIRVKSTSDSILNASDPHMSGFNEVFYLDQNFQSGWYRLQFHTPFNWNGTDNLIIEFSHSNNLSFSAFQNYYHTTSTTMGLASAGDRYFYMNGVNYIEADTYKGIGGSNPRTVEAWIKTTVGGKEIVSWGRDASGTKWNFRLDGPGELRVEVNGGNKIGTTKVNDGKWHHVACTFSGSNVNQVKLYVDGVLEGTKSQVGKAVNTDITNGINVRVSRGTNNRYFTGIIDEVRIWDAALPDSVIAGWRHKKIDASHPNYTNLKAWYAMNEMSGSVITDSSSNANHASIIVGNQRRKINGLDLNKEFVSMNVRPNVRFLQGSYNLSISTDTIIDTVQNFQHSVTAYTVHQMSGTKSDSISSVTTYEWQAAPEYLIDTNGNIVDTFFVANSGNVVPTFLEYFRRYPMRFEIMSFVTPYGIGLDFGMDGETWTFDLTDFSPVLNGDKRLTMEWGGQWQEEMDIQFLFIVGTPPRDVVDIDQIWRVTKPSYNAIKADLDFRPRSRSLPATASTFVVRSAITGHGQEGEFIPREHELITSDINAQTQRERWEVWSACGANPVHPQGGTWIYDRAGWCPGEATALHLTELANATPNGFMEFDYDVVNASGNTSYIVNHQLVSYGDPNHKVDASISDILSPTSNIVHGKTNYTCANPTIMLKNLGSDDLTSVEIEYWINDADEKETYSWSGNLAFNEEEVVELSSWQTDLWTNMKPDNNRFYARLSNPNGTTDEYVYNNSMKSNFEIPAVVPNQFVIWFKTNNAANENELYVYDEFDQVVFSKTSLQNNREYRDTLNLGHGCYRLRLNDSDNDGISFWANNDGNGFLRITNTNAPFGAILETLEPDFGSFIEMSFTTGNPLSVKEYQSLKHNVFNVYPNPVEQNLHVQINDANEKNVSIYNASGQRIDVTPDVQGDLLIYDVHNLTKGIYLVMVEHHGRIESRKVVIK